jgi:diphthine synthase
MLYLISLGLHDEKDMSIKAIETAAKCGKLYVEFYTTKTDTNTDKIAKLIERVAGVRKEITELKRSDLEENSHRILAEAEKENIGILVGGDALVATTHSSLVVDARKKGIKVEIVHGSSIYSAVAETGLHIYKFGKTTTLAFPEKNYNPISCYDAILMNKKMGLHTLVLLDVKKEKGKYMSVKEGLELLLKMELERKSNVITSESKVVAACKLGSEEKVIRYGTVRELVKDKSLSNKTPAVIVIPGELHFTEEEFLETLKT